ncbi:hypothetical protein [Arthrobacter sp. ZGTC412]|uniref:hypothetical protein n=1 Tax=Arthrobacter sp. ZGTC412 TaxID=2058900 RepID=UPI000CE4D902|nr:hypothetical protein [Arthrobacter sp. ZGTC412]
MTNQPKTVEAVRDEIISAIAEVRAVARSEHDEQRNRTADWLDALFVGVTDAGALRAAAADALSLYGGNGSFSDVGTAESHHAVTQLGTALRRGRSWFMPETVDQPVAVRATAFIRPSKWLHRPVRLVRYDAYWADGRVEFGVNLRQMMPRVHTTDFAAIDANVHANCPETGAGQWVDESGSVVEGPSATELPSANSQGVRRKYRVSRYQSNTKSNRMWRLGGGTAALGLGAFLTTGPISDGIAGFLGVLFCIFGLASLAGLIPRKHR